jgi:hypothetical protein
MTPTAPPPPTALSPDDLRGLIAGRPQYRAVVACGVRADDLHWLSWGREPLDKLPAAGLSDRLIGPLNDGRPPATVYEDFRMDAARNEAEVEWPAAENERLRAELAALRGDAGPPTC